MAKKTADLVPNLSELDKVEPTDTSLIDPNYKKTVEEKLPIPTRLSPQWSDYLMTQFDESELVVKKEERGQPKYPRVHGLRRLAQIFVGQIVRSEATCLSPPKFVDGSGQLQPTSFLYTIEFEKDGFHSTFSDAADVFYYSEHWFNQEEAYARYPSAVAVTRAESRVLRKALGLAVCSAEELSKPLPNGNTNNKKETSINPENETPVSMDAGQHHFIHVNCERVNLHPWKFINTGERKYKNLKEVTYKDAVGFCRTLMELVRSKNNGEPLPDKYRGIGTFTNTWVSEIS